MRSFAVSLWILALLSIPIVTAAALVSPPRCSFLSIFVFGILLFSHLLDHFILDPSILVFTWSLIIPPLFDVSILAVTHFLLIPAFNNTQTNNALCRKFVSASGHEMIECSTPGKRSVSRRSLEATENDVEYASTDDAEPEYEVEYSEDDSKPENGDSVDNNDGTSDDDDDDDSSLARRSLFTEPDSDESGDNDDGADDDDDDSARVGRSLSTDKPDMEDSDSVGEYDGEDDSDSESAGLRFISYHSGPSDDKANEYKRSESGGGEDGEDDAEGEDGEDYGDDYEGHDVNFELSPLVAVA
ncbi:hypothetical protein M422DRAFT_238363 [Sphaerobolus stellatus SS14]|nr:hypothetical protein M422DRAFT_238363 [Sphaerobolus stellatus SS14]